MKTRVNALLTRASIKKKRLIEQRVEARYIYCDFGRGFPDPRIPFGAIAQLGERLNGIQEVGGSTPPGSTKHFADVASVLNRRVQR